MNNLSTNWQSLSPKEKGLRWAEMAARQRVEELRDDLQRVKEARFRKELEEERARAPSDEELARQAEELAERIRKRKGKPPPAKDSAGRRYVTYSNGSVIKDGQVFRGTEGR